MDDTEPEFVLDASALIALLRREPGMDVVQLVLDRSAMSTVNWSEVCHRMIGQGFAIDDLRTNVEALGVELVPMSTDDAEGAASLWPVTTEAALSLGDRACLALARRLGVPALTTDRAWLGLELAVEVRSIR